MLGADPRMKAAFSQLGWNHEHDRQRLLRIIVKRIEVAKGVLRVQLDPAAALGGHAQSIETEPKTIEISYDVAKSAAGVEIVTAQQSGSLSPRINAALINGVARGLLWCNRLLGGGVGSIVEIARQASVSPRYVIRMLRMGFLAPDIIEAVLEGRQTAAVTLEIFRQPIPLDWSEQRLMLGFVE